MWKLAVINHNWRSEHVEELTVRKQGREGGEGREGKREGEEERVTGEDGGRGRGGRRVEESEGLRRE